VRALPLTHRSPRAAAYRRRGLWRPETIWAAFAVTAAHRPEKAAAIEDGRRTSFATLAAAAERLAAGLSGLGIGADDAVALQLPNWTETRRGRAPARGSAPPRAVRITGRRKDIIIRKGENISARELEELLAESTRRSPR
jgi:non-ribosomal peptide synthetase component E (peptide arylation enzyme)